MFYNSYRATRTALQNRQYSAKTRPLINPRECLINQTKRQKLKNLLMTKFMQKYNIKDPNEFLDLVLTQFIQGERLNDIDLKKLDLKICRLNKEFNNKNQNRNKLENYSTMPLKTEININHIHNNDLLNNLHEEKNIKIKNKANQIKNLKNEFPSLKPNSKTVARTESNIFKSKENSCYTSPINRKMIKSPEQELEELEKEMTEEELMLEKKKKRYKRIDFGYQGDEWSAIVNYNKNLYQRQLREEKIKDLETKKRTKECLDIQIKEKLKNQLDDKLKDKEFDEKIKLHTKQLDEKREEKLKKIYEQINRLKIDRDNILKNENMKKEIEKLKEKKFEKNLVKMYKAQLEQDRQIQLHRKRQGKEDLLEAKKVIEEKQKKLKEEKEKEIEEEKRLNKLRYIMDQQKENERNSYYKRIKSMSNKYILPDSDKILRNLTQEGKTEEEKIQHYYEEKNLKDFEREIRAKIKRQNDKIEIKKFLDMQIEQKKKEEKFLKLLDQEQARIWKLDLMKRNNEMKTEREHIKNMNKKNFEGLLKQIEEKQRSKSKKNIMTESEYAMNRDLLEKANEDYLKGCNN
jgi:hypothetical protein